MVLVVKQMKSGVEQQQVLVGKFLREVGEFFLPFCGMGGRGERASKVLYGSIAGQQLGILAHPVEIIFHLGLFQPVNGSKLGYRSLNQGIFEGEIKQVRHQQQGADANEQVRS